MVEASGGQDERVEKGRLLESMRALRFTGATGSVSFDDNLDRWGFLLMIPAPRPTRQSRSVSRTRESSTKTDWDLTM